MTARALPSLALLLVLGGCASTPPPAPPPALTYEQKVSAIIRHEDRRVLREPGAPPAVTAATAVRPGGAAGAIVAAPDPVTLLGDIEARVRRRAALAIGRIGLADGIAPLVARLTKDPEPEVRQMCAFALGLIGRAEAVDPLRAALTEPSPLVRGRAAEALGLINATATAVEIGSMIDGYVEAGALAGLTADEMGFPLSAEAEAVRLGIYALARLKAYQPLAAAVLDPSGQPRSRWWPVAYAFRRVADERAGPVLRVLAQGDGVYTRAFAARGLGVLKDTGSLNMLRRLAASAAQEPLAGVEAIRALAEMRDAGAYDVLAGLLRGGPLHPAIAVEVVRAIGAIGQDPSELLLDLLSDRAPSMRAEALSALVKVDVERFLTALSGLDRDSHWSVRAALADAVAELPVETATRLLEPMMGDEDVRVVPAVLAAMAKRRTPRAGAIALESLTHEDPYIRSAAAQAVAELDPDGAVEALKAAIARSAADPAYDARAAALTALTTFGRDAALPDVEAALSDREWAVRMKARQLLAELDPSRDVAAAIRPAPTRLDAAAYEAADLVAPPFSTHAYIETDKGTVQIELAVLEAPLTARNFVELARAGAFDGVEIHRVVANFVVQDGDRRGDGAGGPGYTIRDELNQRPYLRGTVGMALDWADTGGSQFFITHSPQPHLDPRYTVFGQVVSGMEVVDQLARGDVIRRVRIWDGRE